MELKGKKVAIFGLGKSGLAAKDKLSALGAVIRTTDSKVSPHTLDDIAGADLIVVSPGVHLDIPVLREAKKRGIKIVAELELASWFIKKPIVAITGTNGKTTTTTLVGEMLKAAGRRVFVGGNIGAPLAGIADADLDYIVAEVSSYQLEACDTFKPYVSVLLNIQPDHLERHHTMAEYIQQKARIFANQTGDDYLVYNEDDPEVKKMVLGARCRVLGFAKERAAEIITIKPEEIKIPGKHNLENALAAAQAAALCGVPTAVVAEVLKTFPGVEHRIEYAVTVNGVDFYNDSKGTNPDSTMVAIDTFPGRGIVLILGGKDKGTDLQPLARKIRERVKAVVTIGEAAERFTAALKAAGYDQVYPAGFSLADAVKQAQGLAKSGDLVLFSPACASFDMFNNYEERGRAFKQLCRSLKA
ncbi:MAG: UDP-N-acetylmuramoyl-L-alanine--D-glutamate ligase [Candidatus Margulisiibacteriota bacterium]